VSLLERRLGAMGDAYRLFYDEPLTLARGEGVWLYDPDGRAYLDVYNNVPIVGHCHPHVAGAVARQLETLNTHTRYLHEGVVAYAERLLGYFPGELDRVMFACSGTEAVELALRMARAHTGGSGIVVTAHAYHGNSWAVSQISPEEAIAEPRGQHVVTVPAADTYRGFQGDDKAATEHFCAHLAGAIGELEKRAIRPAAFILDTVCSSEGVIRMPAGYLAGAARIIREAGGVFIADEVQAGFGRTGGHFWGFEQHGVVPDIVTLGKPMGSGYPVSAVVTRRDILGSFSRTAKYFNTFGGSSAACAAANAVLDVIEAERLQENAREAGAYLLTGLRRLAAGNALIGDIRGSGLYIGVDLVRERDTREPAATEARRAVNALRDRGVLVGLTGPHRNVLKFRPPLVFSAQHADLLIDALEAVLPRRT
jgi:4-aminobutyrate aminotransferase-like enzyme